jgi:holo-[acyl-carrier protein] synthase
MRSPAPTQLRVGIDLVQISRIAESLEKFGDRFLRRVFTEDEIVYATAAPSQAPARLAARFAAKEAAVKALGLADRGVNFREIEVRRSESGECALSLRGGADRAARLAGLGELAVSLSHEGDYATAVVIARLHVSPPS